MKKSEYKIIIKKGIKACAGFTLMELMASMAIVGILSSIATPNYIAYRQKAKVASVASELKNFERGFVTYLLDYGEFPDDCHLPEPYHLPNEEITNYVNAAKWAEQTPLGGNYNWEGPDQYAYAGISLFETKASQLDLEFLDRMVDDGDLSQGKFRLTENGRYTYILEE